MMPPIARVHLFPDRLSDLMAQPFRVLNEPMRIEPLDRLGNTDAIVSELCDQTCGGVRRRIQDLEAVLPNPGEHER